MLELEPVKMKNAAKFHFMRLITDRIIFYD